MLGCVCYQLTSCSSVVCRGLSHHLGRVSAIPSRSMRNKGNRGMGARSSKTSALVEDIQGVVGPQVERRTLRDLAKPLMFTCLVAGASYSCASVAQYERFRSMKMSMFSSTDLFTKRIKGKAGDWRAQVNNWWNGVTLGDKAVYGIIGANVLVFGAFRISSMAPLMARYFMSSPYSVSLCLPMVLSTFGHSSLWHLGINMYVLHSFSAAVTDHLMGVEQFLAFYLTAGCLSSFASYIPKILAANRISSIGASGAILGVLGYACMKLPDSKLSIIFLPMITFSASTALIGLVAIDGCGLLLGWQLFDHAAHLGGCLFGVWYAVFGEKMWHKHRHAVVDRWIRWTDRR